MKNKNKIMSAFLASVFAFTMLCTPAMITHNTAFAKDTSVNDNVDVDIPTTFTVHSQDESEFTVTSSGKVAERSVKVNIKPKKSGAGYTYIAISLLDRIFFLTKDDENVDKWVEWKGDKFPSYIPLTGASTEVTILNHDYDVLGAQIYAGYGIGSTREAAAADFLKSHLKNKQYAMIDTVSKKVINLEAFATQSNVEPGSFIYSEPLFAADAFTSSVNAYIFNGEYSVGTPRPAFNGKKGCSLSGKWSDGSDDAINTKIKPTECITLRHKASKESEGTHVSVLTLGDYQATFTSHTKKLDISPDPISFFIPFSEVFVQENPFKSGEIAVTGINTSIPISIVSYEMNKDGGQKTFYPKDKNPINGMYCIKKAPYNSECSPTDTDGSIGLNDKVEVQFTAPVGYMGYDRKIFGVELTIGEGANKQTAKFERMIYELCPAGQSGAPGKCAPPPPPPACPPGYSGTYPNCVAPVCPSGYSGTYPNCVPPPVCPPGYSGTYPNCIAPAGDTTPPTTTAVPSISTAATDTTVSVTQTIDEAGTGYYVILPFADAAPSAAQVQAGTDSADVLAIHGTIAGMVGGTPTPVSITGLTASTAYKYYFVAKDSANNLQTAVSPLTGLDITTTAAVVGDHPIVFTNFTTATVGYDPTGATPPNNFVTLAGGSMIDADGFTGGNGVRIRLFEYDVTNGYTVNYPSAPDFDQPEATRTFENLKSNTKYTACFYGEAVAVAPAVAYTTAEKTQPLIDCKEFTTLINIPHIANPNIADPTNTAGVVGGVLQTQTFHVLVENLYKTFADGTAAKNAITISNVVNPYVTLTVDSVTLGDAANPADIQFSYISTGIATGLMADSYTITFNQGLPNEVVSNSFSLFSDIPALTLSFMPDPSVADALGATTSFIVAVSDIPNWGLYGTPTEAQVRTMFGADGAGKITPNPDNGAGDLILSFDGTNITFDFAFNGMSGINTYQLQLTNPLVPSATETSNVFTMETF